MNSQLNTKIYEAIEQECMGLVERSEEGERLFELRRTLGEAIREKIGFDSVRELDDLTGGLIVLYGEEMFKYGLEIGRNPMTALTLPDSGFDH